MTVDLDGNIIRLQGDCRVEEAEPLLALLQADPGRTIDLSAAGHLHAAVVQVLLALRPAVAGPVADPFVKRWLAPCLLQPPGAGRNVVS